jgi:hypothetical protein
LYPVRTATAARGRSEATIPTDSETLGLEVEELPKVRYGMGNNAC